jgi:hypothetical protein
VWPLGIIPKQLNYKKEKKKKKRGEIGSSGEVEIKKKFRLRQK